MYLKDYFFTFQTEDFSCRISEIRKLVEQGRLAPSVGFIFLMEEKLADGSILADGTLLIRNQKITVPCDGLYFHNTTVVFEECLLVAPISFSLGSFLTGGYASKIHIDGCEIVNR